MMRTILYFILILLAGRIPAEAQISGSLGRKPVDSVGFATAGRQMDSVTARILRDHDTKIQSSLTHAGVKPSTRWKTLICPHDDYAYASWLYPAILQNVKAPTVILIGVAHKARKYNLENKLIFGSFPLWAEPYGAVPVSSLQNEITRYLPSSCWIIHDSLMAEEHSLEAIVPFLQYYNRNISIIPILIPYMSYGTLCDMASSLASALSRVMDARGMIWGKDYAIVISNDAVHYGDEEWGGKSYARFGADRQGYRKAIEFEMGLITSALTGSPDAERTKKFYQATVSDTDYKEYKWTWCGRYAVPFGLQVTSCLAESGHSTLTGSLIGYKTSLTDRPVRVEDLGMGTTAIATIRHWVGYAAIGYE